VTFTNYKHGQAVADQTRVWSLGGYTPEIVCEHGRLRCRCEQSEWKQDGHKTILWQERELSCTEGELCTPRYPGHELSAAVASSGSINKGLRPWGLLSDTTLLGDQVHEACTVRGMWAAKAYNKRRSCASSTAHDGPQRGFHRAALGSGRCEDVGLERCGRFYSRVGCEWRLCNTSHTVKVCDAITRINVEEHDRQIRLQDEYNREVHYSPNDAEEFFSYFDRDENLELDKDEWNNACNMLEFESCTVMFERLDPDGHGTISMSEFVMDMQHSPRLWRLPSGVWNKVMEKRAPHLVILHAHSTKNAIPKDEGAAVTVTDPENEADDEDGSENEDN